MRKSVIIILVILMLIGLVGCGSSPSMPSSSGQEAVWPENLIDIRTNLKESKLDFHINGTYEGPIYYTILYNGKTYKYYTKTEKDWSILYDYSFKDVTKVTVVASAGSEHTYEKSVLVVIDPTGFDFKGNFLETYYASRYARTIEEIAALGDNLVSVNLEGPLVSGDLSALKDSKMLKFLSVENCPNVTGDAKMLKQLQ